MGLWKAPAWLLSCCQCLPAPRVALILLLPLGAPWSPGVPLATSCGLVTLLGDSDPFLCPKGESWPESPMSLAASLPSPDRKFCPSLWEGALGELPRGATLLV